MTTGTVVGARLHPASAAMVDRIGSVEFPTKRNEAWRHAPRTKLAQLSFGPAGPSVPIVPADVERQIPRLDGLTIVIVNGVLDRSRSNLDGLPAGLDVQTLVDVAANEPERLDRHFRPALADAYSALNVAYGTDGVVITVGEGQRVDTPIHIIDIVLPNERQNAFCAGVVIDLGAGAVAIVVETRIGGETTNAHNAVGGLNLRTTITLGANASLEHIVLQDLPRSQVQLGTVEVVQAERSEFRGRSFNLGASFGRLAYHVELAGNGARTDLSGLFFGGGEQVLDQHITVVHAAKDCVSRQSFRGVLDDESVGVFNGGIDVRPGADGTNAEQFNANLLLSRRAEVNTQPRLAILADDVACKHGATVGRLDEEALYYLRSRGIPAEKARRLLIDAFADQTLEEIGIETVRAWVSERLRHNDE